jgi:NAD(P)H-dependent flavin oxidoreductase YrpB (nitropropane dioxygenase family)
MLAVDAGADILVAQGNEAGGHTGHIGPHLDSTIYLMKTVEPCAYSPLATSRRWYAGRKDRRPEA